MSQIAPDPVRAEYARLSYQYDRRWSFYVSRSVEETLRRVSVQPSDRVLDIGCGTGALLRSLRQRHPRIELTGVDASAEMLAIAAEKLGQGARLCLASAQRLPVRDEVFDLVISTSALHYFRDPTRALAEMKRVVRPQGRIAITDWCRDFWTGRLLDRLLCRFNAAHYRAYTLAQCAEMLQRAGLHPELLERYKIDWLWGLMTVVAVKTPA
ncbi:MAG: methyltransferase domain-containing protein [Nitrococcus mobilis]|nr:methyltransferase domain-containing protein [Nitrococcus mobilis]